MAAACMELSFELSDERAQQSGAARAGATYARIPCTRPARELLAGLCIFIAQVWEDGMDIGAVSSPGSEAPGKLMEYRQRASECRALARELSNEGSRKELLDLADVWMSLADTRHAPSP